MVQSTTIPESLAGGVLTLDLAALKSNYRLLAKMAGKSDCGAAVKGDAYGIGISQAAPALWSAGCRTFFVARPAEGAELRKLLPKSIIYVLDGLYDGQAHYYAKHGLRPALVTTDQVNAWAAVNAKRARPLPCALHVDTGINRLGLTSDELRKVAWDRALLTKLNVSLLMSHLACADDPAHRMNRIQLDRFRQLRKLLPQTPASLANSSGIFLGKAYHFDLVRPGVALYGGNPVPQRNNPVKAVATLEAVVLQVRHVKKGETVGYSATWQAKRNSKIALLGAGYRDGIARKLSSGNAKVPAQVVIAGKRCPIIGRVSMDMMGIDVTGLAVTRGMRAQLIGAKLPVDEVAGWAGTISYEVLTHLGNRYARVYKGSRKSA